MNQKKTWVLLLLMLVTIKLTSQETMKIDSANFKDYLDLSKQYYKEFRYNKALSLLEQLHAFDSTHVQVTNQLAELYSAFNNRKKALYFLSKTLQQDSMNLFAHLASGDIFLRNGDPSRAQTYYFNVINKVDSNNYYAYRQIANSYHGMGEDFYPLALRYYKKALENNHYDIFSYSRMGNIYNVTNQYHLADSICNVGLRGDSLNSTLLNIKAYALFNLKKYMPAIENFDLVFQKSDSIAFSLKYTGLSYFNLNNYDKAKFFLERSIAYDSTDYDPMIVLGQIYLQKDEYEKGLATLTRAEKLNYPPPQKWSEIFKTMADIYNQQKQWDKAIECFQQAYRLNPEDKTLICKLAYQYDYLNQREKAIALYTKVIETADSTIYVDEVKLARERLQKLKEGRK